MQTAKENILAPNQGISPNTNPAWSQHPCAATEALKLAAFGLKVFPCMPTKKPYLAGGFKAATTDPDLITQWWQDHPDALVGVPTGRPTGLLVVDIDPVGAEWYSENFYPLKASRIHTTPRGHHLLYQMPEVEIPCSVSKIAPGVDVRGEGGYVIWWPCMGLEAVGDMNDVADPPDWLLKSLTVKAAAIVSRADPTIIEGTRNLQLASLGGSMRRRGMGVDAITAALLETNSRQCKPPLPDNEVHAIARSMAKYAPANVPGCRLEHFRAYMPDHRYIFIPTRDLWPASSVDSRLEWPVDLNGKSIRPSHWLAANASVEQMTWAPGLPMLIENRLIDAGGWIDHIGSTCFNLYRPPALVRGDPNKARPWLEHVSSVYPDDAEHIIKWLAHRVQRPGEKLNHALVLGGRQGIGKDTLLEPVKQAVGPWNCHEVSPAAMLGRFNGFVKSVILRVSEARDLGDVDRFAFYDHTKALIAAPPDVIRCDEKNIREHPVPNVCGVIITTNHKSDGLYLPADDRRHYVAWSDLDKDHFEVDYWNQLWGWYGSGGIGHVAAYLASLDLSGFDAKAPPLKTEAFWHIVNAARTPEESELADILDQLNWPEAVTLDMIKTQAGFKYAAFADWMGDRRNRRQIPHRLESAGYEPVRNSAAKDGLWKISGRRQAIYAKTSLPIQQRQSAALEFGQ